MLTSINLSSSRRSYNLESLIRLKFVWPHPCVLQTITNSRHFLSLSIMSWIILRLFLKALLGILFFIIHFVGIFFFKFNQTTSIQRCVFVIKVVNFHYQFSIIVTTFSLCVDTMMLLCRKVRQLFVSGTTFSSQCYEVLLAC